ncbi:MAG: hypothetical protein BHW33_01290 [Firmicutes bacterium CAG:137_57_8]|nr:MAG: hypothetical protein BHW33_01290 [Firmicutes bacterium CAG:137_57_8]
MLNMAGLARIAALETGADGAVTLETGLGSLLVEAELNGKFAWSTLEISGDTAYRLVPQKEEPEQEPWAWDFIGEGLQKEALVQRQGMCLMYNETSRYAETARGKGCRSGIGPAGPPGPDRKLLEPPVRNRRRSSGPGVPDGRRKRRSPVAVLPDHPGDRQALGQGSASQPGL